MSALMRFADDVVMVARAGDAVVLRDGTELLRVPGAGPAAGWLARWSSTTWDRSWLSNAPSPVRRLVAILETHEVAVADSFAAHLMSMHAQTVGGDHDVPPVAPDAAFLVRDAGTGPLVPLPPPELGTAPLHRALRERRSARTYGEGPIPLRAFATILGSAAGTVTRDGATGPIGPARSHPSGGALYPIETHVIAVRVAGLPSAAYRYLPLAHKLSRRAGTPPAPALAGWLPDLPAGDTAAVVLLSVELTRPSLRRYGGKAYRLALLEAGHIAQNLLLVSTVLGIAHRPLCGFDDEAVAVAAGLAYPMEVVVYAVALGPVPSQPGPVDGA